MRAHRYLLAAVGVAAVVAAAGPARADRDDFRRHEWRERREWRERPFGYGPPPFVYSPPPPVYYRPPPVYYTPPGYFYRGY